MKERFVLFSLPRCGSTTLMHLLNCHPRVQCSNEPFNKNATDIPDFKPVEDRETLEVLLDGLWERYNGIKHVWTPAGWPFPSRSTLNEHMLIRAAQRVIFLHRRNLLQQIVSNEMSLQSRIQAIRRAEDREKIAEFQFEPIKVRTVVHRLRAWRRGVKQSREALLRHNIPFLELAYEDLFDAALTVKKRRRALDDVLKFLGLDVGARGIDHARIDTLLDPARSKVNSAETYRLVPGIEKIEQLFGSKRNGRLFESSGRSSRIFRLP